MAKALEAVYDSTNKWVPTEEGTYPAHITSLSSKGIKSSIGFALLPFQ